jgi:SulP family sulfate permease
VFRPESTENPEDEVFPGFLILRPEGRIFFANAELVGQKMILLIAQTNPKVVVIDMSAVFDIEYTALKMLTHAEQKQREQGVELWLTGLTPGVLRMVMRSPLGERLGQGRMFFNIEQALAAWESARARQAGLSAPANG